MSMVGTQSVVLQPNDFFVLNAHFANAAEHLALKQVTLSLEAVAIDLPL
jgi:hypothetical protein